MLNKGFVDYWQPVDSLCYSLAVFKTAKPDASEGT